MSVHEAISTHTRKMHSHLEQFQILDEQREAAIERALTLCAAEQPFSIDEINACTARINEHAKHGISPTRPYVTEDMVRDFVKRSAC
ncbi:YpbS family protein [Paenibacillus sp. UNC451MF]|uniref:YpbS family protein n=1 Tax=Paenibacillus sp. UNC451MF TaxID=1449063 RepID=UPI00048EAA50|nr:YpbS family protein [Paenibacillus sp. UNC451MF]